MELALRRIEYMRSYCLYNGNYVDIAEIYEVRDGKQINIPEKLKYYRKLSDNRQLFCSCGCGEVVILVAGDRNLRKQHFRLLHKFANSNCEYQEESDISVKSKIMLKCWLSKNLPVIKHEIKYRVPISQLVDNKRRYELSMYSEDYDIGMIYNKHASSILEEKVELLSKYMKSKIIYVTRIENEETKGQYPERMMRIQEAQGYCFYLDLAAESIYEEVGAKISIYEQTHCGLWEVLDVCMGMLDDFGLNTDGTLVYKGELVSELVNERKRIFQKNQEHELEQIRKSEEEEQLRQEKLRQEEEERARIKEEVQMQKELELQKEREEKQRHEEEQKKLFLEKYPKFARIYYMLKELKSIKGDFASEQGDGRVKNRNIELAIADVKMNIDKHRIEVLMDRSNRVYIYIWEHEYSRNNAGPKTGVPYRMLDYTRINDVEHHFRTVFTCVFKETQKGRDCSVPEINCRFLEINNICSFENNCSYKKR